LIFIVPDKVLQSYFQNISMSSNLCKILVFRLCGNKPFNTERSYFKSKIWRQKIHEDYTKVKHMVLHLYALFRWHLTALSLFFVKCIMSFSSTCSSLCF